MRRLRVPTIAQPYGVEVRACIPDGAVLLFRGRGPIARMIQAAGRSAYSHVGLAIWVEHRLLVAESREWRGVRLVPLSATLQTGARVDVWVPTPAAAARLDVPALRSEALAWLSQPYGWGGIVRIGLGYVSAPLQGLPIVGRWIASLLQTRRDSRGLPTRGLICSAYVSRCYRAAGVDLVPNLPDAATQPGDLPRGGSIVYRATLTRP